MCHIYILSLHMFPEVCVVRPHECTVVRANDFGKDDGKRLAAQRESHQGH